MTQDNNNFSLRNVTQNTYFSLHNGTQVNTNFSLHNVTKIYAKLSLPNVTLPQSLLQLEYDKSLHYPLPPECDCRGH